MATPRSLWPFFRDLDLLRLLERATANPDPVVTATVDAAARAQSDCRADLQRYLEGLSNYSSWAAQSEYLRAVTDQNRTAIAVWTTFCAPVSPVSVSLSDSGPV